MTSHILTPDVPVRHLQVVGADHLRAVHGVNEGEPLGDASELILEDVYQLDPATRTARLALEIDGKGFRIARDSAVGTPGAQVFLDALVTFMTDGGETTEALVFVEVDPADHTIAQIHVHPLAPFETHREYTLVTVNTDKARARLAATAAVAFTRGTRITMADGRQMPIEELRVGDRVLTRDSGPQVVRWVGVQTVRAAGDFAPILIAAGALNNTGDLLVSPNHRLFIYQRVDALGTGRKEILVKAALLVNGDTVTQKPGGFIDYFQVLFDKHEILYAEGIAAESLFVDTTTRPALPEEVSRRIKDTQRPAPWLGARELVEADVSKRRDPAAMLKRISAL